MPNRQTILNCYGGDAEAALREVEHATAMLRSAMEQELHPNRVNDFVADVNRWSGHLRNHLKHRANLPVSA